MITTDVSIVRARADCVGLGLFARLRALHFGWPRRRAEELSLVIIELTNNSVRHAGFGRVQLAFAEQAAELAVEDEGPGFPTWVLDRFLAGQPIGAPAHSHGLGAGLDSARRFGGELTLENLPTRGARVRASIARSERRTIT
jgi:anti-sigma regulatory factor (Ser/Thr protein kinase)